MILIEGSNQELRAAMGHAIREALILYDPFYYEVNEDKTLTLQSQLIGVHLDTRCHIRNGTLLNAGTPERRRMIAYGLSHSGSVLVNCGQGVNAYGIIPSFQVDDAADIAWCAPQVANWWLKAKDSVDRLWDFYSTYHCPANMAEDDDFIMLVGDRPPRSGRGYKFPKKLAFVSHHGASLFLHDAMMRAGGKYYLTNYFKYPRERANRDAIIDEINFIKPSRIVALGSEAAGMLVRMDIGAPITNTHHPKYWQRFRADQIDELVRLIRP
jgi:hypothetical protein